jgi:hypothetical protein
METEIAGKEPDLSQANGTALEPLLSHKLRRRVLNHCLRRECDGQSIR